MATNTNYTTKTAALKATRADVRQVQVSKKLTSKEVWIDDAEGVSTNVLELIGDAQDAATTAASSALTEAKEELNEAISAVSDKVDNMKMGIDIGTKKDDFADDDDTTGFLNSVSKLNFKGKFVTVIKKDNGTVDLWINPDNNYPEVSSGTMSGLSTGAKYVFASSTNAWDLPTTAGSSYSNSHPITQDQTITIKGTKDDVTSEVVSVGNLTSKLRAEVVKADGTVIATNTTPYITREPSTNKEETGSTLSCTVKDGITFTVTQLRRYVEEDTTGPGWDAAHGFVPDSVSFKATVKFDTSAFIGVGNTYKVNVYLDTYNAKDELQSTTTLHEGSKYYAYTSQQATIGDGLTASVTTPVYHNVSGVQYYTAGTEITVTTSPVTKATVMAATNATKRASITLSDSTCDAEKTDTAIVSGAASDNETTTIASATKVFTLGKQWVKDSNDIDGDKDKTELIQTNRTKYASTTSLTVTQLAHASGNDATKTYTLNGNFWANPRTDNGKNAYFESEGGAYGRVLGYMDGNKLVLSEDAWDSTQPLTGDGFYGKQAKVDNGKCSAPAGGGVKYYVRKFNYGGSNSDQLSKFNLTVPGAKLNGTDLEVWLWTTSNLTGGKRCDLATGNTDPYGFKGMCENVVNGVITVAVEPTIMQGEDFYIAVKIAAGKEITSDIVLA